MDSRTLSKHSFQNAEKNFRAESQKQTELAVDLYKRLVKKHPGTNVVFSPISIAVALSMVAAGARGPTLDQFHSSLKLPTGDLMHEFAAYVKNRILADASRSGGPSLVFANSLWVQKGFSLKAKFQQILKGKYQSEAREKDFLHQAEDARKAVNDWAEEHTKGKIKDLLPEECVDRNTKFVLANAIYFKGTWKHPFTGSDTKDDTFYLQDGKTVTLPMMTSRKKQYIAHFPAHGCKALRLPYAGGRDYSKSFSMYFLLPDERTGLPDLEKKLDSAALHESLQWHKLNSEVPVSEFKLPRFRISSRSDSIKDVLQGMGLVLPFSPGEADFSELAEDPVAISEVLHKAFVEVNEEGTEAAAATAVVGMFGCAYVPPQEPQSFVADHPFLFFIKEDNSGLVLFVGKVTNPLVVAES